jgi:hypothetical protein
MVGWLGVGWAFMGVIPWLGGVRAIPGLKSETWGAWPGAPAMDLSAAL